jgi:hypothetical protein
MYEIRRVGERDQASHRVAHSPLNDLSHRNNVVLSVVPPLRPHHSSCGSSRSAFGLNLRHQAAIQAKLARFEEFVQRALDDFPQLPTSRPKAENAGDGLHELLKFRTEVLGHQTANGNLDLLRGQIFRLAQRIGFDPVVGTAGREAQVVYIWIVDSRILVFRGKSTQDSLVFNSRIFGVARDLIDSRSIGPDISLTLRSGTHVSLCDDAHNLPPLTQKHLYDVKDPLPSKVSWHVLEDHDPDPPKREDPRNRFKRVRNAVPALIRKS